LNDQQEVKWAGYVQSMEELINACKYLV